MSGQPIIIVKKKVKGHGGHGAAWKVAYADFVTAMMALFIVLWLLAQTDQNFKKELSQYFRTGVFSGAPSLLDGGSGLLDKGFVDRSTPSTMEPVIEGNADAIRSGLNKIVREEPGLQSIEDNVRVTVTREGVLIEFIDNNQDLLFELASSALKPPLEHVLQRLAPILTKIGYKIRIQGHTDARPFPKGAARSNWSLSFERADQARRILERSGLPEQQLIGVFAHGAAFPLDPKNPGAPENRRLSLLAVPPELAARAEGQRIGRERDAREPKAPLPAEPGDALTP
jgi:chemotaxis protein MotB